MTSSILVTEANFVHAETDRMFSTFAAFAGGVNLPFHILAPTPLDAQTVIRMNRDTLYSAIVVDLSEGAATLTVPDAGGRYMSAAVVNHNHHINRIYSEPGEYSLTIDEFETPYVAVLLRVLVDPEDPADVAAVNAVQHGFAVAANEPHPYPMPDWDTDSLDAVRATLLERTRSQGGFGGAFGSRAEVDPEKHLLGAAAGWGGLPEREAMYVNVDHGLPVGEYRIVVNDVPVDAFWSISMYNARGFFEQVGDGAVSVSSVTAGREPDGSVVVHFGGCGDGRSNCIGIMDGWNYVVRMYRPRPEVVDGSWTFPDPEPIA
jgi:hypothetical protein